MIPTRLSPSCIFYREVDSLLSYYEKTKSADDLDKVGTLIKGNLLLISPGDIPKLHNLQGRLRKVGPNETLIQEIEKISSNLKNGQRLLDLPKDLILLIVDHLDTNSFFCFGEVGHTSSEYLKDPFIMKGLVEQRAKELPLDALLRCAHLAKTSLKAIDFHLSLSLRKSLTDNQLGQLALHCPNLEAINLSNCSQITEVGLGILASLRNLRELSLNNLNDKQLKELTHYCSKLEVLNLEGNMVNPLEITNEGLKSLTNLRQLRLDNCHKIDNEGLKGIVLNLQHLEIVNNWFITDNGLTAIAPFLTNLKRLDLVSCTAITKRGLIAIAPYLTNLRRLDLEACWITTAEVKDITASLKNLEKVNYS